MCMMGDGRRFNRIQCYRDRAQKLVVTDIRKVKMSFGDTRFNAKSSYTSLTIISNNMMEQ
jgi:hypothetical protein